MASVSFARPGKAKDTQYIGDLASLIDRQRRRFGIELSPESFAADLAQHDSLRSALFTLCNAISHMGETDLSAEELLIFLAKAMGAPETESGPQIPESMRTAFLAGFTDWQERTFLSEDAFESLPEPQPSIAAHAIGHRTLQEALSLLHADRPAAAKPQIPGSVSDLEQMTLAELKAFLEEIEQQIGRLAPQLQKLNSTPGAGRQESDLVIPFPRQAALTEPDRLAPLEPAAAAAPLVADAFVASRAEVSDERPPGIDALLAAAPAWANTSPTARPTEEEVLLARQAYTAASVRPVAAIGIEEDAAEPLLPTRNPPRVPTFGMKAEVAESSPGRLRRLPSRRILFSVAGVALVAGCLAGAVSYRLLHSFAAHHFSELEPVARMPSLEPPPPAPPALAPPAGASVAAVPSHSYDRLRSRTDLTPAPVTPIPDETAATDWVDPAATPAGAPIYVPAPTMIGYAMTTPQPEPPAASRAVAGTVSVELVISPEGNVTVARAVGGPAELYAAAVAATRGWHFRPYVVEGKPVTVETTLQFYFKGTAT